MAMTITMMINDHGDTVMMKKEGFCDICRSNDDDDDDIYIMMKCVSVCNQKSSLPPGSLL